MWMQDGCIVCMDSYMESHKSCHLDFFQKPPRGGRPNTKLRDHGTPNIHNHFFLLFYHVWGPAWKEVHWNSIWLRARSHMTSHYTWGPVPTLHDLGGVLGQPLDTFFWALNCSPKQLHVPHVSWSHGHGSWLVCKVALSVLWYGSNGKDSQPTQIRCSLVTKATWPHTPHEINVVRIREN